MKKIFNLLVVMLVTLLSTSCLKSNLEPLPNAKDADILSIQSVAYRWVTTVVDPASGENKVQQATLTQTNSIDKDAATVAITATVPSGFPQDQRANLDITKLVVTINIPTGCRVTPMDGAPTLGVAGDWSSPRKYKLVAADGTEKVWTITLTLNK